MNEELTVFEKNKSLSEIADDITNNADIDDELINMFNSALLKKNLVRISRYDTILDDVINRIEDRLNSRDIPFSNGQLLEYLDTIQKLANNASETKVIDTNIVPKIQYNNQVNVIVNNDPISNLDRESKERIVDAIKSIINDTEKGAQTND